MVFRPLSIILLFNSDFYRILVMRRKTKKSRKTKKIKDEEQETLGLSRETKNGIWGVVSLGLVVVTTLAFFDKAGRAGELFATTAKSFFGWGIFLIPLALLMLGIAFLKSISRKIYSSAIIGTVLFVLSFLAVFSIIGKEELVLRVHQGGYLGLIIGFPLFKAVGFTSSFIILVILIFVSVLVALNIPVHKLFLRNSEEDEEEEDGVPLKDNVVIKRGSQIIDARAEEAAQRLSARAKSVVSTGKSPKEDEEEREFVIKSSKSGKWILPPIEILHSDKDQPRSGDINANVTIIKRTLSNFGIDVEMGEVSIGPTVTQFTLRPAVGVKVSKIYSLQSDLSLALAAHPIRIEAPIPGKPLVGIEVPNKKSAVVGLRDLLEIDEFRKSRFALPIAIGRDVAGFPVYASLEKMPHLLVAGATGTGKSVTINAILLSLLYKHSPDMLKLILIDPKRVELSLYNGIPHLITPVIINPKKVVNALRWAVREMEKRYERLSDSGSRDIASYNVKQTGAKADLMPFIIVVIDELADLMAAHGRDVEASIVRLAQMARAVGIHLIVSTQRPSVEVITGLIKANITSRMALQVGSQVDSRTILDASGAEKLLGNGDMLFQSGDVSKFRRLQGAFVNEKEVKDVVKFIKQQAEQLEESAEEEGALKIDLDEAVSGRSMASGGDMGDELFDDAKEVVIQAGKASASLLQRRLKVGYARAARLLDLLEEVGMIGPGQGAKPREVYIGREQDDGSMAEVASADSTLDDKIAVEE